MTIRKKLGSIYVKFDRSAGRTLFGNAAGLGHNISGNKSKKKYGNSINSAQNSEDNSKFESNGYFYLDKADLSLINEINSKFQKMIEDDQYSVQVNKPTVSDTKDEKRHVYIRKLRNPPKDIPEIKKLFTKDLVKRLEGCIGGNFSVEGIQCWRNYHIPPEYERTNDLFSNLWHCDYTDTDYTKLFFYLMDVTENEGPIHMVSPKRTKELIKSGYTDRYQYDLNKKLFSDEKDIFKGTGSIGTTLLVNTEICLHKAGNPTLNHYRDTIQLLFKPSPKSFSDDWADSIDFTSTISKN